jgi:hypothetical protein
VPSVGAYFAGQTPTNGGNPTTDGRSYCPASTVASTGNPPNVSNEFIPLTDQDPAVTDQIAATTDGKHILGAHANGGASTFSDIDITNLPTNAGCPIPPAAQPTVGYFTSTSTAQNLGVNAATITGVEPASNSAAAFVTYTLANGGTGGLLPLYLPPASGKGTLQLLTLGNSASNSVAPVAGVFSTDNFTFFVGTGAADGSSNDDDVHLITMTYPSGGTPTAMEAPGSTITPQLPLATGTGFAPVNLLAQHPKKTTS